MSPSERDVEGFVAHCREQLDGGESLSRRAVGLRIVEPLLERLGWDLHGSDVEPEVSVEGARVDYLLTVSDLPAIAVVATDSEGDLRGGPASTLADVVEAGTVDRGLATDGRAFVFVVEADGSLHRQHVPVPDLPERTDALATFTRTAARERLDDPADPRVAATRLARRHDAAIDAVVDALVDVAGEGIESAARAGATTLVEALADVAPGDQPEGEASDDGPVATSNAESVSPDASGGSSGGGEPERGSVPDGGGTAARTSDPDGSSRSQPDGDGEFVVRFFGSESSVGAVGGETPGGALAGAVGYLVENHGLADSIELPWGLDDERSIVAGSPAHPGGRPMEFHRQLAGGAYVWTGADAATAEEAIEALADAAGLRAMFQGDW